MNKKVHNLYNEHHHNNDIHIGPYWKRMHKDWRFWLSFVFVSAAIIIYIMSLDLRIQPVVTQHH